MYTGGWTAVTANVDSATVAFNDDRVDLYTLGTAYRSVDTQRMIHAYIHSV